MTGAAWRAFRKARDSFRALCEQTGAEVPFLTQEEQHLIDRREGPPYQVRRSVVYNEMIDEVSAADTIALILVADNPGRREQDTGRYLVGPSGKIAEHFFRDELNIDFRKQVIILNKTPVHTPRTVLLRDLNRADPQITRIIIESQRRMAAILADFYRALEVPVWIIGYSEMNRRGVFAVYTDELKALAAKGIIKREDILFFRHFSMNQFTIDLKQQRREGEDTGTALKRIGVAYRERILDQGNIK